MCGYQWNIGGEDEAPISWKGWQGDLRFSVALKTEEEIIGVWFVKEVVAIVLVKEKLENTLTTAFSYS